MKKISVPSAEELRAYFIDGCHTKDETCEYFNVSPTTLSRWFRLYDIRKTEDDIIQTNLRKYGVAYVISSPEAQTKKRQTCLNKYGVANAAQAVCVQEKIRKTCLEKYGCEVASQADEVKKRIAQTCLDKYGAECVFSAPEVQQKIRTKWQSVYGTSSPLQAHITHLDVWESPELFQRYLQSLSEKPTVRDLMYYFNVSDVAVGQRVRGYGLERLVRFAPSRSRYEDELVDLLHQWGVNNFELNNTTVLAGKEIDIYIPDYHLGIEFNGDYWHSDIFHADHGGRSTYHQEKALLAEQQGIFLFQIYEHEWNDARVKSNILNRLSVLLHRIQIKIPARACTIAELSKQQKRDFLEQNHIQGNDHSVKQYGLFYEGELVACMTFAHPKSKQYTWELSRFCNRHGYIVQGGASKLFTYFVKQLRPGDVVSSYSDITKTTGGLYSTLGFSCVSINMPNYVWMNFNTGDIRTRYQETGAGEEQRMREAGYHRVCDCGTKTWIYIKPSTTK